MDQQPVKIGVVGCGHISGIYLEANRKFEILDIVACADIDAERAKAQAEKYEIPRTCSVEELLADDEIDIVVNLTVPKAHVEVNLAAIKAGKSVHTEKPLAIAREDGIESLRAAAAKGVRLGAAPDTFLGAGLQTCRKLIDDGAIGEPVAATAFMAWHGPEGWHPDPEFFYQHGGGPMFDMGPYYLTALVHLMGPIRRVTGSTRVTFPERTITSKAKFGRKIKVEVPTHVTGVLDFASGAVATMITSFDIWSHSLPRIEIYGSEGTLFVPDPNTFGGPVYIQRMGASERSEVPLTHGYSENSRGMGVADMAYALRSARPHRCSGELAYHVLDVMHSFQDASDGGRHADVESTCSRPAPLPVGLLEGTLDE